MHELDASHGLGNSMVYAGDLPWHRYGQQIPAGLSVEDAIAACPAVDFETVMRTLYIRTEDANKGQYRLSDNVGITSAGNARAIVRSDTEAVLGVATSRYQPIQIRDQWRTLDPLIDAGLATIETLGSLKGGQIVWGLVKFNPEAIPEWDELVDLVGEIRPYGIVYDVKNGGGCATLAGTSVRVVCRNTLEAASAGFGANQVKIRHTGDVVAKLNEAADELWGDVVGVFTNLRARYTTLVETDLTQEAFNALVLDPVAVVPTDPDKFASYARFQGAQDRAQAKRDAVASLWKGGAGHKGDGSAWEALNGLVEALDHNRDGAFREGTEDKALVSLLSGTKAALKGRVTSNLLQFAAAA